ncbi:MAG: zinc ribbon domain-containing protein [Gemmatimonadales bacterium]|jgi:hypothetical protein
MSEGLATLLRRRMADEQVGTSDPIAVAELHKRLLPYHVCRDRLGYATKAEYDLALLQLLADDRRLAVSEPALREAVRAEIRHPEPGLAFLHRFAASEVRVLERPEAPPDSDGGADEIDPAGAPLDRTPEAAGCRSCGAPLPAVDGVRFCPSCGTDQVLPTCDACDAEVDDGWSYCAFCGASLDADAS